MQISFSISSSVQLRLSLPVNTEYVLFGFSFFGSSFLTCVCFCFLIVIGFVLAVIVLGLLGQIRYIGWIFMIALFLLYIAGVLFLPIFMGLVRTAFFEEIGKVSEE